MNLATGTQLGPYEVERVIGKGGMGEVYAALDRRLGRTVAIKILLASANGHDEEQLRRFELEARTVGALNHPNLLTLHDIGRHDGRPYIVTELLTGRTLRRMLQNDDRIEINEALRIAAEIARGLAAAHAKEIVHRDIKPENLFVIDSGRIKILDFGVAKLADDSKAIPPPGDSDPALVHTALESIRTSTGMVIGTPGYMAPEQLRGDAIDGRTDVFALGVVLYELLNRKRPFEAETSVEESYGILKLAPAPSSGRIPEAIDQLIRRCLEKKPDARFQSASDLAFALDALVTAGSRRAPSSIAMQTIPKPVSIAAPARPRVRWPLVAIGGLVALAGAFVLGRETRSAAPSPTAARAAATPTDHPQYRRITFGNAQPVSGRFVKDERTVVYTRKVEGGTKVFKSQIDQPSIQQIADGRLVDLSTRHEMALSTGRLGMPGELTRVHLLGGSAPRQVASSVIEAAWAPDAERLAIVKQLDNETVLEFPVDTPIRRSGKVMRHLRMAPKGELIAFVESSGGESRGQLIVVDGSGKKVAETGPHAVGGLAWNETGTEVWFATTSKDPAENGLRVFSIADSRERIAIHTASFPILHDLAPDGRVLFSPIESRIRQFVQRGTRARDESWFDGTVIQGVSADGRTLAFIEGLDTGARGTLYAAFVRIGNAPPTQIGYAAKLALTADGSAAIALTTDKDGLQRLPTGRARRGRSSADRSSTSIMMTI